MDIKSRLESSLSVNHRHLLNFIADIGGGLGFPIYIVGGSVRDLLLGRAINDFDLTVEGDSGALAESLLRKLGGKIMVHSKFGTARWTPTESTFERLGIPVLAANSLPPHLDFVSTRTETYSTAGALPTVKRASIEVDLRRRDFTVNALAVRIDGVHFGELVDVADGRSDIERGLIRVLHPKSFIDDPTRMFRAVRYAVRYGFEIEPETLRLINEDSRHVLSELSGERLRNEFDLIFEEANPNPILEKLNNLSMLAVIHPSLSSAAHNSLAKIDDTPPEGFGEFALPDILSFRQALGWVLYLMNLGAKEIDEVAERLDFPLLVKNAARASSSLQKDLSSFKNLKPSQWTIQLDETPSLAVYGVWLASSEPALREYLTKWQNTKPITTGDDLIARGLEPGPMFKEILANLRAAWLDAEVTNAEQEKTLLEKLISDN